MQRQLTSAAYGVAWLRMGEALTDQLRVPPCGAQKLGESSTVPRESQYLSWYGVFKIFQRIARYTSRQGQPALLVTSPLDVDHAIPPPPKIQKESAQLMDPCSDSSSIPQHSKYVDIKRPAYRHSQSCTPLTQNNRNLPLVEGKLSGFSRYNYLGNLNKFRPPLLSPP